ncbi:MAG: hypothetical protein ABWY06_13235 [Pseudomonas sp.]|uniref:hypothetical protein n=1 Tax=Pseudomonas sp. TaxID=306 RepID=UPI0033984724
MRIRGTIGAWPVDLTLELDGQDWASLRAALAAGTPMAPGPEAVPEQVSSGENTDALWQGCLQVLREAGQLEGTALLATLTALAGSAAAGKRLLVRLRHDSRVRVQHAGDTPVFHWLG